MAKGKLVAGAVILITIAFLLYLGPDQYLNLEYVKSKLETLTAYKNENPVSVALYYCLIYIGVTAASIPGALVLTLLGGAIFGFLLGSVLVLISATIGATIAFLVARYLFDDLVQKKMGERVSAIRESFRKEGALYLFSMRLVPAIPFFAVNLLMGLTSIKTTTYIIASFTGMAPGSTVFVNAGTQLSKLESLNGLLSPTLLISFILLALFPYAAKYVLKKIKSRSKSLGADNNG